MPFVAFDLQGTLCNYEKAIQTLEEVFSKRSCSIEPGFFESWYRTALLDYIAISQSGKYQSLLKVLRYTLPRMMLCKGLVEPSDEETDAILGSFEKAEPYIDVVKVMELLRREGWDIWILSNSGRPDTIKLLDRMKLLDYVGDNLLCCDELQLAKPHPKIYSELMRLAVRRTKRIENFYLVGSYSWEVASAKNISLKTVFLNTNEKLFPAELYDDIQPDIIANNLIECTSKIIEIENARKQFK